MKLKHIWGTILVIGVACLAVCLLPWSNRINVALPAVEISAEGTTKDGITMNIEGWYRNYIFRQDSVRVSIRIEDSQRDVHALLEMDASAYDNMGTEIWSSAPYYNAEIDRYDVMTLAFDESMNTFVLLLSYRESTYVAAPDVGENLPEILKTFNFVFAQ